MARKKYHDEPDNHERWLVSYADFMTLLFAFFVVMYAISQINEGKYRVLSNSLTGAFGRTTTSLGKIPEAPSAQQVAFDPLSAVKTKAGDPLRKEREKMTGIAKDILVIFGAFSSRRKG